MRPYTRDVVVVHLRRTTQMVASNLVWERYLDKHIHRGRNVTSLIEQYGNEVRETAPTARIQNYGNRLVLTHVGSNVDWRK